MRFPLSSGCVPASLPANTPSDATDEPEFGERLQDAQGAAAEKEEEAESTTRRASRPAPETGKGKARPVRTPARDFQTEKEEETDAGGNLLATGCPQQVQPRVAPFQFSLTPAPVCSAPPEIVTNSSNPNETTPTNDLPAAHLAKATGSSASPDAANLAITVNARPKSQAATPETAPVKASVRIAPVKEERRAEVQDAEPVPVPASSARPAAWTLFETRISRDTQLPVTETTPRPAEALPEIDQLRVEQATPVKASGALRNISVQVGQIGQPRVEVQVVERSGEVYVAVRSDDAEMVRGLRNNLPELVNRFEDSGFTSAGWRPSGVVEGPSQPSATRQSGAENRDQQPDSQSGGSHPGPDQREQRHSNRRQWTEEFEGTQTDFNRFSGELHGFSS